MYRVLALDGGGCHGYACLMILNRLLEKKPTLLEEADVITGTSIGAILGLGFATGHTIDKVEENFIKGIPLAFQTNIARLAGFVSGICTKYDNKKFKLFLNGVYGNIKLKELKKKVVIPSFCIDNEKPVHRRWRAKIFHNFDDSDETVKVIDVAMATSAVPVFFPAYDRYVDGALIANNPTLCAVAQTQDERNFGTNPSLEEISVLSIGTIRDIYIPNRNMNWGYFKWAKSLLNIITERDTLVINYMANLLLKEKYHRIEPVINGPMDNFDELSNIKQIGMTYPLKDTFTWLDKHWSN